MFRKSALDSFLSNNTMEDDVMEAFQEQEMADAAEKMTWLAGGLFKMELLTAETIEKVFRMKKFLVEYDEKGFGYDELNILMNEPENIDEELSFLVCTWFVKELLTDNYIVEKIGKCGYKQLFDYLEEHFTIDNKSWCKRLDEMTKPVVYDDDVYYLKQKDNKMYTLYKASVRDEGALLDSSPMSTKQIANGLTGFLRLDRERKCVYAKCAKEECYVEHNLVTGDTNLRQVYEVPWVVETKIQDFLFVNEKAMEHTVWKMIVGRSLQYKYPKELVWLVQELNLVPPPENFRTDEIISSLNLLQRGKGSCCFIEEIKRYISKCDDDELELCMKLFSRYEDEIKKYIREI